MGRNCNITHAYVKMLTFYASKFEKGLKNEDDEFSKKPKKS